jgi:hypothetical protein
MTEPELLRHALKGNVEAVNLCLTLFSVSQTWDDLTDGDKEVAPEAINAAFWNCLVALPSNKFYQLHEKTLGPLVQAAIVDWLTANDLEKGSEHDRTISFVLRDQLTGLVVQCALLIGGYEWMRTVAPDVRRYFHDETLEKYNGIES